MDAYCVTILLVGISISLGAINIAATVVTMRAPGMTWTRLPIFVWSIALVGDLIVFADLNYPAPLHAYRSFMSLFILYHAFRHLVVGLVIGALVLGRLLKGGLVGRDYVIQATGYWFWWIAITAVLQLVLMITIG